jgi:hypothetical protein
MTTTSRFRPLAKSLPAMEGDDFDDAQFKARDHCAKRAPHVSVIPWVITAIDPDGCTETRTFCDEEAVVREKEDHRKSRYVYEPSLKIPGIIISLIFSEQRKLVFRATPLQN